MRKKMTKKELAKIWKLYEAINALEQNFDEEAGKDVALKEESNGTVGSNLSCASAALCTILQEYC